MNTAKQIRINKKLEVMRVKHANEMKVLRDKLDEVSNQSERSVLRSEYNEMLKDLIDFDTFYIQNKYVIMNERNGNPGPRNDVYVNMETGKGYFGLDAACEASGLSKQEMKDVVVAPYYVTGYMWRRVHETIK